MVACVRSYFLYVDSSLFMPYPLFLSDLWFLLPMTYTAVGIMEIRKTLKIYKDQSLLVRRKPSCLIHCSLSNGAFLCVHRNIPESLKTFVVDLAVYQGGSLLYYGTGAVSGWLCVRAPVLV